MKRYYNPNEKCAICKTNSAQGLLQDLYHDGSVIGQDLACWDCGEGYVNLPRTKLERGYDFEFFPIRSEDEKEKGVFYPGVGWVEES